MRCELVLFLSPLPPASSPSCYVARKKSYGSPLHLIEDEQQNLSHRRYMLPRGIHGYDANFAKLHPALLFYSLSYDKVLCVDTSVCYM